MNRTLRSSAIRAATLAFAALAAWDAAAAQQTRTVRAGERYEAGGLRTLLLGENYRDAWTAQVSVPVLNPDTFAGGLTVQREGGGLSTESLRFLGRDGREYVFRSVDKDVTPSLGRELRGTIPHAVVQDLVSAKHPAAALIVPPLLDAVGVLHATPRLFVMPDHPFLGEHRQQFAGRLGQVEVRPTDGDDRAPPFAGADDVEGSDDFRKALEEDPENRLDTRAYLTARLMDVLVGDWDRHWDQWRWARFDRGGLKVWRPIPRDRDNAFASHEGLIPAVGRGFAPQMTKYGEEWGPRFGLIVHPAELDRRLLSDLSLAEWDSVAQFIRTRVTDRVIDDAVRRLPPEHHAVHGEELARGLKARRDAIPEFARWFYAQHAREVDIHSTDEAERAEVTRLADGGVEVVIHTDEDRPGQPYYRRRFTPAETREVRLFLHGGDDQAVVRGTSAGDGILVRVLGGGGDDRLRDESSAGGGRRTVFHDDRGDNRFEPGREAKVDEREWEVPRRHTLVGNAPPPRDWGQSSSLFTPWATWQLNVGPVVGVGPTWIRYGFRRYPYARMTAVRALWAPLESGFGVEAMADFVHTNRPSRVSMYGRASNFADVRFHGFGNESPDDPDRDEFEVEQRQVHARAFYHLGRPGGLEVYAGPVAKFTEPQLPLTPPARFAGVRGTGEFWQLGGEAGARVDARDSVAYPRRGLLVRASGNGFGTDLGAPFGMVSGDASTYLTVPGSGFGPTLALRAGGQVALGDFPFQESAWIGGPGTVRGYPYQRYRGDAAVFGQAELRARLGWVNLGVLKPRVGVFALGDAGRVYVDEESAGDWHTALGGGFSFEALGRSATVAYVSGEKGSVYVTLGMPF